MIATIKTGERRPRVLVIAESANPEWASVPLIGWCLFQALAKTTDAHLVTQIRNKKAIVRAGLSEGEHFTSINNEHVAAPLSRLAMTLRGGAERAWTVNTAVESLAYYSFERAVWREFKERLVRREFDLVHRITPLSPTSQSVIARKLARINIPFIMGPLNGGLPWPVQFLDRRSAERDFLSIVRGLYKFMPAYRSSRRYSSAILVGSQYTYQEMPISIRPKCLYLPENGVDPARFNRPRDRRASIPLKGAFVGRLVPYKGADMLLEGAAEFLQNGTLQLHIIGDGPQRAHLEAIIDRLGVRSNVHFHGWIPHPELQEKLRVCDFLALPSVREFGGGVVLESMALGVTPIVANYGGPAELIDEHTGIRIQFTDQKSLIEGIKRTIEELILNPKLLDLMGAAGRIKVAQEYSWSKKADVIAEIYESVLQGRVNGLAP